MPEKLRKFTLCEPTLPFRNIRRNRDRCTRIS